VKEDEAENVEIDVCQYPVAGVFRHGVLAPGGSAAFLEGSVVASHGRLVGVEKAADLGQVAVLRGDRFGLLDQRVQLVQGGGPLLRSFKAGFGLDELGGELHGGKLVLEELLEALRPLRLEEVVGVGAVRQGEEEEV
jgi:hypothetical protein